MSDTPTYTDYHPRWYRPRVSTYWWMKRWSYFTFILRELSSIFIAWFIVFTLLQVRALNNSENSYRHFQEYVAKNPFVLGLNLVSFVFVLIHTVTWFSLTPKAMVVRVGGKTVPGSWLVIGNYIALAVISAVVAWLVLGGG